MKKKGERKDHRKYHEEEMFADVYADVVEFFRDIPGVTDAEARRLADALLGLRSIREA